ncbi:MAG: hypothetical protein V8T87_14035 [Victivallales bacterium]
MKYAVCSAQYDMYDHGYFTVYPALIDKVKAIDPEIELCTTHGSETRSNPETLKLCRETDGCRFVQPVREFTTEESYRYMRELGLRGNVFFTDDPEEMSRLKSLGAGGHPHKQSPPDVQPPSGLRQRSSKP